jgi:nucleotide-binding universal stress UspA family protein
VSSTDPVLLTYDGSPSAAAAIAAAGRLAASDRAVVCNAWPGPLTPFFRAPQGAKETAAEGAQLAEAAGFEAEPRCVEHADETWRAILHCADEVGASMLVAGAQGRSGLRRALLGSVSTGLVHHARVPVLIVPGAVVEASTGGPLLLCYDGSELSAGAISAAGMLLAPRSALVLSVWESWVAHAPALAGMSRAVLGMAEELDQIADELATDLEKRGVEVAALAGFDCRGLSESAPGSIWRTVLDTGDEHSSAAIVLGSRGLGGMFAAMGSVSNGVVHHSRRPVFVVPAEAAAQL